MFPATTYVISIPEDLPHSYRHQFTFSSRHILFSHDANDDLYWHTRLRPATNLRLFQPVSLLKTSPSLLRQPSQTLGLAYLQAPLSIANPGLLSMCL